MDNTKVAVLGDTGFLGKRMVKYLEANKIKYIGTSLSKGVDMRRLDKLQDFFVKNRPDVVINCAAYVGGIQFGLKHEGEIFLNNILMSTNLIEASRLSGVKKIINPISNCSYPDVVKKDFIEEEWWNGPLHSSVLVYGFVRKAVWVQSYAYARQYGMQFTNLIVPNMYGPDDHFNEVRSHALGALIMKIVEAKKNKTPSVTIWGTGKPIREWLYVDDCVKLIVEAIHIDTGIDPINVGKGEGSSIAELASTITKIVKYDGELVYDTSKEDGAMYKIMNVEKMKKMFANIPRTGLVEGINATVQWYLKHKSNS